MALHDQGPYAQAGGPHASIWAPDTWSGGGDGGCVMVTCAMRTSGSGCATPIPRDQALHASWRRWRAIGVFPSPVPTALRKCIPATQVTSRPDRGCLARQKGPALSLCPCRPGGSHCPQPGTGRRCRSLSTSSKPQVYCGAVEFSTHPALRLCTQAGSLSGSLGLGESHGSRDQTPFCCWDSGLVLHPSPSLCTALPHAVWGG